MTESGTILRAASPRVLKLPLEVRKGTRMDIGWTRLVRVCFPLCNVAIEVHEPSLHRCQADDEDREGRGESSRI